MPKHFDVVFTNPPYNRNLDLKMIKMLLEEKITDRIICVQPASFLFCHNENNKVVTDLKNSKSLEEVTLFWGNEVFNVCSRHAHCISVWNIEHNSDIVTIHDKAFTERKNIYDTDDFTYTINVRDITVHSKIAERTAKLLKQFKKCDGIWNHHTNIDDKKTHWGIKIPPMRTGLYYTNRELGYAEFFSCLGKGKRALTNALIDENFVWTSRNIPQLLMWYFNSEKERTNFINYLKLKIVRFIISLNKNVADVSGTNLNIVPWLNFTKHYSEEDLKKLWNIDEELWDYIDKFIPDYYEDYRKICRGDIK